ncbi:hypothetical protein DMB66_39230 [Actinoplanes sp. ATCC 53533]|uniref:hypothetical protein n=1 Tax=Actinoplanes sp. ATCC 53533 TaxID=1288362 RepID=UPI000F7AC213|nr:hypothetical protein [Actinoplanes sp. ATCC 53533]RSM53259.1 hypothetical protein DMB66_39230 [Actinoplanes sp. ATCC 53533]
MRTTDSDLYALRRGASAVFSGDWLAYLPERRNSGDVRYYEGYHGVLHGRWNGGAEFTVDATTAHAIVTMLGETAEFVSGSWLTVTFDGDVLIVRNPWSLGGGVTSLPPRAGQYRIGWGLPWFPVDPARCDRVAGHRAT